MGPTMGIRAFLATRSTLAFLNRWLLEILFVPKPRDCAADYIGRLDEQARIRLYVFDYFKDVI
jgi:hypothetical protein